MGHVTKTAAMLIYGKSLLNLFFSATEGPISTKLCMYHSGLEDYNMFINHDMPIHGENPSECSPELLDLLQ